MITVARKKLQHLWRGDEGVALAMFIIVCPTLLLIAFSAFQLGEVVRQRIILQNATDAGAYAGAIVQADALSRLGVLNEAMACTYVQGTNLQQDLLVGDMLIRLNNEYLARQAEADGEAYCQDNLTPPPSNTCNHNRTPAEHTRARESGWPNTHTTADNTHWGYYIGVNYDSAAFVRDNVYLNGHATAIDISDIQSALATFDKDHYVDNLGYMRDNLAQLAAAEGVIIASLKDEIEEAIDLTFIVNAPDVYQNKATHLVKLVNEASNYMTLMTHADEANFVDSVGGFTPTPSSWWQLNTAVTPGIARHYTDPNLGQPQPLGGWFQYGWRKWIHHYDGTMFRWICDGFTQGDNSSTTEAVWDNAHWGDPLTVYPRKLTQNFIGRDGTIVVGAKWPVENPFVFDYDFVEEGVTKTSKFNLFTAPFVVDQDIWCVSAARAGLRRLDLAESDGRYRTLLDVTGGGAWNLYVRKADWDAVMLPLNKAWKTYDGGNWAPDSPDATPAGNGNRAKDVLYTVYHTFPTAPSEYADHPDQWTLAQNATFH